MKTKITLSENFSFLPPASSENNFSGISLSKIRKDYLTKSKEGAPVFLFHDASEAAYIPGLHLKNLEVEFHVTCQLQTHEEMIEDQFTLVRCDVSSPELFELFIQCFSGMAENLSAIAETAEIRDNLNSLLDLFRLLAQPNGRAITGLWAELFIIIKSKNITSALSAWRNKNSERFDFSWGDKCLEVKATCETFRIHEFSLEQLTPPSSDGGFVVSTMLQPLSGGLGVLDLAKSIEADSSVGNELRKKMWNNVISALGSDFSEKLDTRFDFSYAERNLQIFLMSDIPAPSQPDDERVSSIRFRADLSSVKSSLEPHNIEFLSFSD